MALPRIMVAPNGARKTLKDHPAIPVTIDQIVDTAIACQKAGADGLHAHVRDSNGKHVLDSGQYLELLAECGQKLPGFYIQITTEAVGIYSPVQQDELVRQVMPPAVSVGLKEMTGETALPLGDEEKLAREFYHWAKEAGIDVQHILYSAGEIERLQACIKSGIIPEGELQMLFVLGRYSENQQSDPDDILPFVNGLTNCFGGLDATDWAVCAFGKNESDCLVRSVKLGGKMRIGFENNFLNRDGSVATDNKERVKELVGIIESMA